MKVLLADENELTRIGLRTVIRVNIPNTQILECSNGADLKEVVTNEQPEVILIDYSSEGFMLKDIAWVRTNYPGSKMIAITYIMSGETIVSALKSGITSYVKKDCDINEIIDAIKDTAKGNHFYCGKILNLIRKEAVDINNIGFDPMSCEAVALTDREVEIIQYIVAGDSNPQIAEKLFLSAHTVNTHRKNIMKKLGVKNTAGIVMYAVKSNLVQPNKYLFS